MNIIFLTISDIKRINISDIYADLIRQFRDDGHQVHIVSPTERKRKTPTQLIETDGIKILKVKTLNIQKTNVVEKGIGTLMVERLYKIAIKRYLPNVQFDLILYTTPPITFTNVVTFLKRRNPQAISYLLLKDIFPQNAVDIGMFGKKSIFYWFFRKKEISLYKSSDFIGCMSPANVEFLRKNNPFIPYENIEIAPNSIELKKDIKPIDKNAIKEKYQIPINKIIFLYGGNLGKPQGIDFLIECLDANKNREDCHFVIVGNGTEYYKLESWHKHHKDSNVTLLQRLPKEDYDLLAQSCDIGMIFLDHRFTIPNYPSRLLPYMEYKKPVICATDPNTDIGKIAEENGYGFWCESNNVQAFTSLVDKYTRNPEIIPIMGQSGYKFLSNNYLTVHTYRVIMRHFPQMNDKGIDKDISSK